MPSCVVDVSCKCMLMYGSFDLSTGTRLVEAIHIPLLAMMILRYSYSVVSLTRRFYCLNPSLDVSQNVKCHIQTLGD